MPDDRTITAPVEPGVRFLADGLPSDVEERLRLLASEVADVARGRVAEYHPDVADTIEVTEFPDGSVEVVYQAPFAPEIEEHWGYLTSALDDVGEWGP